MNKDKMELEEAIRICEDFINENKSRPIILHTAIATVLQELENSTPKKKIEEKKKELEEIKTKTGDVILAIKILQELWEGK